MAELACNAVKDQVSTLDQHMQGNILPNGLGVVSTLTWQRLTRLLDDPTNDDVGATPGGGGRDAEAPRETRCFREGVCVCAGNDAKQL